MKYHKDEHKVTGKDEAIKQLNNPPEGNERSEEQVEAVNEQTSQLSSDEGTQVESPVKDQQKSLDGSKKVTLSSVDGRKLLVQINGQKFEGKSIEVSEAQVKDVERILSESGFSVERLDD